MTPPPGARTCSAFAASVTGLPPSSKVAAELSICPVPPGSWRNRCRRRANFRPAALDRRIMRRRSRWISCPISKRRWSLVTFLIRACPDWSDSQAIGTSICYCLESPAVRRSLHLLRGYRRLFNYRPECRVSDDVDGRRVNLNLVRRTKHAIRITIQSRNVC